MKGSKYKKNGWYGESYRHYLAAKGIKTKKFYARDPFTPSPQEAKEKWMKRFKEQESETNEMLGGTQKYSVKQVGEKYMLFDNEVGEFLLGYSWDDGDRAKRYAKRVSEVETNNEITPQEGL